MEKGIKVDEITKVSRNVIREKVLNNIAESQEARNVSRFSLSGTTKEMFPLSQKNVIRLLERRGLNTEMAKSFNKSFDGTIYARRGVAGENLIATENSFQDASGVFLTKGSAGITPIRRIDKLALPPSNKALIESQVKLTRDQILLGGKVAPQPEWATQTGDGIPRIGGEWQIVTNGGKWNGAVEWSKKQTIKEEKIRW